jgi:hypothetical protein
MGGIGALNASFLDVALLAQLCHQQGKETLLCIMLDEALAKFGEHAEIEARIGQFQPKQLFDIHPSSYCICRLSISQILHILHNTDQS